MIDISTNTTDKKRKVLEDYANTIDANSRVKDKKAEKIAGYISGRPSVRDNKESKNIILEFVDTVDVSLLMTIFTMFGTIITTGITLYRSLRKFSDGKAFNANDSIRPNGMGGMRHRLFESAVLTTADADKFEKLEYSQIGKLYESQEFQELNESDQMQVVNEISDTSIQKVIDNDDLLFRFENGAEMESLTSKNLNNLNFSLRYHVNKTSNLNEFLDSVAEFLSIAEVKLTDYDTEALSKHYNKYK